MRTAFIEQLCSIAADDDRVWLVCGDLGFSVLEAFGGRFPTRYLNAGVAEQNMTGLAAGLALSGKTVFTYSIANFPVMRCLEQIRNDVCYHNLNVKIVAVGGGLSYGSHGYTHHGVEDLAVMSVMPNITVAAPADPIEARAITTMLAVRPGPAYLRLGKAGEPVLHKADTKIEFGKAIVVEEGQDLTLISTGGMLATTLQVSDVLSQQGYSVGVISMPFLVPLDEDAIQNAGERSNAILNIEEHGYGGLGSLVGECIARRGIAVRFRPIRLGREPIKTAGTQEQLRAGQGLSVDGIVQTCVQLLPRGEVSRI